MPRRRSARYLEASAEDATGLDWMFPRRKHGKETEKTSPLRRRLRRLRNGKEFNNHSPIACSANVAGQLHVAAHEGAHRGTRIARRGFGGHRGQWRRRSGDIQDFEKFIDKLEKAS